MPASLPRVLAILPRLSPSTWINVVKPLVRLHETGRILARVTLESLVSPRAVCWADVVVFCRNLSPQRAEPLRAAAELGVPMLYDLDDNFFELPPDSEVGRSHARPEQLATLREYLVAASLVRVYSRPLLEQVGQFNARVELVHSAVDLNLFAAPRPPRPDEPIKIVYATSRLDDALGRIFLPALRRLLDEKGPRVEAHFWGPRPPQGFAEVRHHVVIHNYNRFLRRFSAAGFQIGLAPLQDDVFHRSKTNTKFREYGAGRIAGIYSNVETYSSCVEHGETGLLVPNDTDAWLDALRRLVDDGELRTKIQRLARAEVEEHYSQEKFEAMFLGQIEQLRASRPASRTVAIPPVGNSRKRSARSPLGGLLSRLITTVRRNGLGRLMNTAAWLLSSGGNLLWLRWRLRASYGKKRL